MNWNKLYFPTGNADEGLVLCKSNNGYYFVFCTSHSQPYLLKINESGDTLWSRHYNQIGHFSSAAPAQNGGCITGGDNTSAPTVMKLDSAGNVIWLKTFGQGYCCDFTDIRQTADGNYILCGPASNNGALVVKLNSNGDTLWTRTIVSGAFGGTFLSIVEAAGGSYIACGSISNYANDTTKVWIVKLDNSGSMQWEKRVKYFDSHTFGTYIGKLTNQYLITGDTYINTPNGTERRVYMVRIDLNGNTLFSKRFDYHKRDEFSCSNVINSNRYLISSFAYDPNNNADTSFAKVIIFDSLGTIIKQKYFIDTFYVDLQSSLPLPNGDILFTGTTPELGKGDCILIIRTDSLLNTTYPIGIQQIGTEIPKSFQLYQNYPNPFNPQTLIKFDIPAGNKHTTDIQIKVYDLLGRVVWSFKENKPAGSYSVTFDGSKLASGIYFYSLEAGNFREAKRMVLLK